MRLIERELVNGRALEKNIPGYALHMFHAYRRYSAAKLSMNYFTYYEVVGESKLSDENILAYSERFHNLLYAYLHGEEKRSILAEQADALRNEITEVMKGITAWVDIFNIYEYCLNRVEYRFQDVLEMLPEDDELARDILQYVVKDRDQVVVNSKVSECIRQLPIRMTKTKFFQLLREGMSVYKESEKESVDDLVYMIRTISMLEVPESAYGISDDLNEIYRDFKQADFKELQEEAYHVLADKLQYATDFIQKQADIYLLLAENINDLYVMILCSDEYIEENMQTVLKGYEHSSEFIQNTKDFENSIALLEKEWKLFREEEDSLNEQIEDGFLFLEGKQEKYGMFCQKYAYLTETVKKHEKILQELEMEKLPEVLAKADKLLSGSIFVNLEEKKSGDTAGIAYINSQEAKLEEELKKMFESSDRMVNRAVMAHVLSELPVFFQSLEELKDYILQSLNSCRDIAEKIAVAEIFEHMMEE